MLDDLRSKQKEEELRFQEEVGCATVSCVKAHNGLKIVGRQCGVGMAKRKSRIVGRQNQLNCKSINRLEQICKCLDYYCQVTLRT